MTDTKVLDITDKMKLIQWLYPEVYAKLVAGDDNDD